MKNLIQANELRVGNLYDNNGVFKKASPNTIEEVWESPRSWCKPIPLTEEWLFKLGFYKNERDRWVQKGLDKFEPEYALFYHEFSNWENFVDMWRIEYHDKDYGQDEYKDCHQNLNRINYVHQLQNIYFSLVGKELTLKQ